jgi:hypothetical protein
MKKLILILIILTIIPIYLYFNPKTYVPETQTTDGIERSARIEDDGFQVLRNGQWTDLTVKGVNIGMTRPGTWPGEAGITYEEYYRWLEMIGEMNANTIRVYTIHPPAFYEALHDYNLHHEEKIYLFHGVWIDEEPLVETLDAFNEKSYEPFKEEIRRVVDILHGNATLSERPGHASGDYEADVSPYVLGWILGIEWFPDMVKNVDETHDDLGEYKGTYFTTENATGFEYFLADIMDHTLSYEMDTYSFIRPVSFTNWVSTDLLSHPYEPFTEEDMVSVNPNHILPLRPEVSYFASYHVYPYYPDFLNLDPKYTEYVDKSGKKNNYAGYLHDLIAQHDMPVLIAEFGIPTSRGITHENVHGWNQGGMSEEEQGEIVSGLFENIVDEGFLGGLIFSWQDEWFKRTWNTMDLDNPDRRPYWSNAQTNEQHFGLLSFDRLKIHMDGSLKDWKKSEEAVVFEKTKDSPSDISALLVDHDERYLYFAVEYQEAIEKDQTTLILLNTHPGQGNTDQGIEGLTTEEGMEYLITIDGDGESRILVDSYYDIHQYLYAEMLGMIDKKYTDGMKNRGIFDKIRLPLNKELTVPFTGEVLPFSDYETGKLREGITDPSSDDYDSLADYKVNYEKGIIEIRIPWLLLGFTDPSTKEILGDFYEDGLEARKNIGEISFAGVSIKDGKVSTSVDTQEGIIRKDELHTYTWNEWTEPVVKERLKKSYPMIQELFSRYE